MDENGKTSQVCMREFQLHTRGLQAFNMDLICQSAMFVRLLFMTFSGVSFWHKILLLRAGHLRCFLIFSIIKMIVDHDVRHLGLGAFDGFLFANKCIAGFFLSF